MGGQNLAKDLGLAKSPDKPRADSLPMRAHRKTSKKKPPAIAGGFLFWRPAVLYTKYTVRGAQDVRERTFPIRSSLVKNEPIERKQLPGRESSLAGGKKKPPAIAGGFLFWRLAVTYSHTGTPALPSAIHCFTAEFGMGSGGSNALLPPGILFETFKSHREQAYAHALH